MIKSGHFRFSLVCLACTLGYYVKLVIEETMTFHTHRDVMMKNSNVLSSDDDIKDFNASCIGINYRYPRRGFAATNTQYKCKLLAACWTEGRDKANNNTHLCPCLPSGLNQSHQLDIPALSNSSWVTLAGKFPDVKPGGHWSPSTQCAPRRRLAVIIPYRDRERHLRVFMGHIHPLLQRQLVEYRIYVIEQKSPYTFNKAALMNIGYIVSRDQFRPHCVLFNDVDTLVTQSDNMAFCDDTPIHYAAYCNRFNYRLNEKLFGAAVLLRSTTFETVNGFSNLFFGWGAEDDDFLKRFRERGIRTYHMPMSTGRCVIMPHHRDVLNSKRGHHKRKRLLHTFSRKRHEIDGLNSMSYDVVENVNFPLYTWVLVDLKAPIFSANTTGENANLMEMISSTNDAFKQHPLKYDVSKEACIAPIRTKKDIHFLSRVTCLYLCDGRASCLAVEYHAHPVDELDSYCILVSNCSQKKYDSTIELYMKRDNNKRSYRRPKHKT